MTRIELAAYNENGTVVSRWQATSDYSVNLAREVQRNLDVSFVDGIAVEGFGIVRGQQNSLRWLDFPADGEPEFRVDSVYELARAFVARGTTSA